MTDSSGQPGRVYRMGKSRQAGALVFLAIGFIALVAFWGGSASNQTDILPWVALITAVFLAVVVGWAANTFSATVTLFRDAIEVRTLFGRKRLPFTAIRGRREFVYRDGEDAKVRRFRLEPIDGRLPPLDFDKGYGFDSFFYEWFSKLPDLDASDATKP